MNKRSGILGLFLLVSLGCGPIDDLVDGGLPDGGGQDAGDSCAIICETSLDCCAGQVCIGGVCSAPASCPGGCHYECGPGWRCDRATFICENLPIGGYCADACDCYSGQVCSGGVCTAGCTVDGDCAEGQHCEAGACVAIDHCQSREDCAGEECLVCRDGQCTAPPAVCISDQDCCLGMHCNFGACVADSMACESDEDCRDPEWPLCFDGKCVDAGVQCLVDGDCPGADQVCEDGLCVSTGCTLAGCEPGQYCDSASGLCKPGCDSNDDCVAPATCDYESHQCVELDCCGGICDPETQLCDPVSCQCFAPCTEGSCPEGSHCNTSTGRCEPDAFDCNVDGCPAGYACNTATGECEPEVFDCNVDGCSAGYECDEPSGQCVLIQADCGPADFSSPIACGGSASGAFEAGCESTQREGRYAKQFTFSATAGTQVSIDLVSASDTYLYLLDSAGSVLAYDDDGGTSLDSRLASVLPSDGDYIIEATTFSAGVTGSFELALACQQGDVCSSSIACGQVIAGAWTGQCPAPIRQGAYGRHYAFEVVADQDIEISLSSNTVDTFLILVGPDGEVQAYNDDAGLFTSDSYLAGTLLVGGTWTIEATTYYADETGDFELELLCP